VIQSVAVVTGASQGIGRATSIRLARAFSAIVLAARNLAALGSSDGRETSYPSFANSQSLGAFVGVFVDP
jgi:NAD(P)-dependent dehydrogenase (short-subunit alcohol dehydrogenase family)